MNFKNNNKDGKASQDAPHINSQNVNEQEIGAAATSQSPHTVTPEAQFISTHADSLPATPLGLEKRLRPRYFVKEGFEFTCTLDALPVLSQDIIDISPFGVGVRLPLAKAPQVGDQVSFCLFYLGKRKFFTSATVRWLGALDSSEPRIPIGIEFTKEPAKIQQLWDEQELANFFVPKSQ